MICLICRKHPAVKVEPWGWLPCDTCRKRQKEITKPKITGEITTEAIKEDRKIFKNDILQPFRNSELSKEFIKEYPDKAKAMVKEGHITESEIKNAKNVWSDLHYYKDE